MSPAHAQPFGAHGAHWTYNFAEWSPPYANLPVEVSSSYWGTVGTDSCYMISTGIPSICQVFSSMIVTQRNDSVLVWHPGKNDFVLLYNYNAAVGDTQRLYVYDFAFDTCVTQIVTGTGTTLINGSLKRTYTVQQLPNPMYMAGGDVVEDVGSFGFLFPQYPFCDPVTYGLRCYSDSLIGMYHHGNWTTCDTVLYTGVTALSGAPPFSLNTVADGSRLLVHFGPSLRGPVHLQLFDLSGRMITQWRLSDIASAQTAELNIAGVPQGVYVLRLTGAEGLAAVKWVKP